MAEQERLQTESKTPYGRCVARGRRGFFLPGSFLPVIGFRGAVAEVLEVEESPEDKTSDNQHQIERCQLVQLCPLLHIHRNKINANTDSSQYQGQAETADYSRPRNGLATQRAEYKDRQTELCGVVEEFRQVVPSVFSHDAELIKSEDVSQ